MRKIQRQHYCQLAVFLMDYHSGQWSRGYRLLSRLKPDNFTSRFCAKMRQTEMYQYLVDNYKDKV